MSYFLYNVIVNEQNLIYNGSKDLAEVVLCHQNTQAIPEKSYW